MEFLAITALIGLLAGAALTRLIIPLLKRLHTGQTVREEGPSSHQVKSGTPTMGGAAIIGAALIACAAFGAPSPEMLTVMAAFVLFGLLGFLDDYLKVVRKRNLGLRAWQKLTLQIVIGVVFALCCQRFSGGDVPVLLPGTGGVLDSGIWHVPFAAFVMVAMANSVNLTDGLDGLAAGTTVLVSLFFAAAGLAGAHAAGGGFCAALAGACLGFLIFNRHPARVFMGDTGSLALGGGLGAAAIVMGMELFLPIAGFVYVAEALSVIIQVASFKTTGKRVFRMSPIHHHFELGGMSEKKVVKMFWGVTLVFCLVALALA